MGSIFKKATGIVTDNGNVYECYNLKEKAQSETLGDCVKILIFAS